MSMNSMHWAQAVAQLENTGTAYAIATVIAAAGSTPRDNGSKMVISDNHTFDTIGGGQLEYLVTQRARELLLQHVDQQEIKPFPLAAEAGQCCGGSVAVMLEVFAGTPQTVCIFGAGHVAQALVPILTHTSLKVLWIDPREELLEIPTRNTSLRTWSRSDPVTAIPELPGCAQILVLTHDHALDYRLVKTMLQAQRWPFIGLIGSATKAQRFRHRLQGDGLSEQQLEALHCPVGLAEVHGKLPMEVAVSIAADILTRAPLIERAAHTSWTELRSTLRKAKPVEVTT